MCISLSSSFLLFRYHDTGFTVSGVKYEGSLLCVGNVVLSWGPKKFSEITADRYIPFFLNLYKYFDLQLLYTIMNNYCQIHAFGH